MEVTVTIGRRVLEKYTCTIDVEDIKDTENIMDKCLEVFENDHNKEYAYDDVCDDSGFKIIEIYKEDPCTL